MRKEAPKLPDELKGELKKRDDFPVTQTRKYKLITPLYGGGVEPNNPDPVTVVRATEVRGHLRFWWRATRGGAYNGDLAKMKVAEEEIFGSAGGDGKAGPSRVSVRIIDIIESEKGTQIRKTEKLGNKQEMVDIGEPNSKWGYVAFPLKKNNKKRFPAGAVYKDVCFSLEVTFSNEVKGNDTTIKIEDELRMAFWAWETFGGIGARTRRGFGALQLIEIDDKKVDAYNPEDIAKDLTELKGYKWRAGVPHLSSNLTYKLIGENGNLDSYSAWTKLFSALKDFRQQRYPDKNNRPYGRSKWPEPDEIRRNTKGVSGHPPGHSTGHKPAHPVHKRFPRGKFGLPIIFKFKDDDRNPPDPSPATLQGAEHDRLASPLILRPIATSETEAIGLAALLEWEPVDSDEEYTPPGGLFLKGDPVNKKVQSDLSLDEAAQIEPLNGNPDVLKAFLGTIN